MIKHNHGFAISIVTAVFSVLLLTTPYVHAQGGGLILYEQGDPLSGVSHAGQSAAALDASTAYLNPAGLTLIEQSEIVAGIQPFKLSLKFDSDPATTTTGDDGGDAGGWLLGAGFYLATPINDKTSFGFSITAPMGIAYDYGRTWVGRYFTVDGQIVVLDFQPALAYQVNDQLSLGAGINIQYANFQQNIAIDLPGPAPDGRIGLDADSWNVGFSLGALYQLNDQTRIGLKYRSQVKHHLSGSASTLAGSTAFAASELIVPQAINLSVYHQANQQWAILADAGWTNWSSWNSTPLTIEADPPVVGAIPRSWSDTWRLGLGAHYKPNDKWLIQFGASYDSSPNDITNRLPDAPADQQWRLSAGAERILNEKWRVGGTYTYLNLGKNEIDAELHPGTGKLVGDYSSADAHMFVLYLGYKF